MQNDTPQHRLNAYATYSLEAEASVEDRSAILDGIIDICEDIDLANGCLPIFGFSFTKELQVTNYYTLENSFF